MSVTANGGRMAEVCQWGVGFLKAMERTPARTEERLAGLAVCVIAREALLTGRISRAGKERARAILTPVTDIPIRTWAATLLRCASPSTKHWPLGIAKAMILYGISLHKDGDWSAAIDTQSVVADSPLVDEDTRLWAMERRAFAARIGNMDFYAEMAYERMYAFALETGSDHWAGRARKGLACVAIHRGRYADAQRTLYQVLDMAERSGDAGLAGDAHHGLAWASGLQHHYDQAFRHVRRALQLADRPEARRRAVQDLGEAYAHLATDGALANALFLVDWLEESDDLEERREAEHLRHEIEAARERLSPSDVPVPAESDAPRRLLSPYDNAHPDQSNPYIETTR